MGNMIDVLTDQMDNIASSAVESATFDKSKHGRIIEVLDGNKYIVKLSDGTEKSVLSLTSDSFVKDDVVVVSALQNDPKNSYIIGKPGVSKKSPSGGNIYVDEVLEFSGYANFPSTGETDKIYVDTTTNRTYRWSGSIYTEISSSLALGETSSTAYAGDKGKAVTDGLASHKNNTSNPHSVTASQVGLGAFETTATNIKMNGTQSVGALSTVARSDHVHPIDTSRAAASHTHTVSNITDLTATASEINVLDGITASTTELNYCDGVTSNIQTQLNSKANMSNLAAVATSGSYSDLSNKPAIPTISNTMISRANDNSAPAGSAQIDANLLDGYDSGYFANIQLSSTQPTGQRTNDFWLQII